MGRPIIADSTDANYPPKIFGFPLFISEYAPNEFASGKYAMLLGNMKYYYCIDSMALSIQRLEELYAETNQLGLIIRYSGDGKVVTENAFVRLVFK